MNKAPDAFRTISEVSEWLDTPTYVLRFWESRFAQIKPVKRAGGRRYYRPEDMLLLGGIKKLLHFDGHTIKGVQILIKEKGVKHVSGFSPGLDEKVVSPEPKDDAVKVDIDNLIKDSRIKERAKARPAPLQLNETDKDIVGLQKQGAKKAVAPKSEPAVDPQKQGAKKAAVKQSEPAIDPQKQGAKAVKITMHKKTKAKAEEPVPVKAAQKSKPAQKTVLDIPKDKLSSGPFKVSTARSYGEENFAEIETLYYSLKMVRNNMKRAHAAR